VSLRPAEVARIDAAIARAKLRIATSNPDPDAKMVVVGMPRPGTILPPPPEPKTGIRRRQTETADEFGGLPPPGLVASARLP
jgi:hypothetical protein